MIDKEKIMECVRDNMVNGVLLQHKIIYELVDRNNNDFYQILRKAVRLYGKEIVEILPLYDKNEAERMAAVNELLELFQLIVNSSCFASSRADDNA